MKESHRLAEAIRVAATSGKGLAEALTCVGDSAVAAQEALDKLARVFNKVFGDEHRKFEVIEPVALTVKDRHGMYSTRSSIGGEQFTPSGAYVGKRGSMIFVFKPLLLCDYAVMEMEESKALRLLQGFNAYVHTILSRVYDKYGETVQETVRQQEEERRVRENTALLANPDYASW